MKTIVIKPHHLLDIIKLYGAGREEFVPDPTYGHDFYKVGNTVLAHPDAVVRFTRGGDDICAPCIFFKEGRCTDFVKENPVEYSSKELWNREIDRRLMDVLGIANGDAMSVRAYCQLAQEKLSPDVMTRVWRERPADETARRIELLSAGLYKYLRRWQ